MLTAVRNHNVATASAAARGGDRTIEGRNGSRYPTKATASAALADQTEIQYPHATRKPGRSPNARRVYAYGPPDEG
jgi:hypothetical protein